MRIPHHVPRAVGAILAVAALFGAVVTLGAIGAVLFHLSGLTL